VRNYNIVKEDKFPYFTVLAFIWFLNILFNSHFNNIFFAGIVFIFFIQSVKREDYYLLLASFLTFCFIEVIHGLIVFSLSLITVIIYVLIIPQLKHIFNSKIFSKILYLFVFYFSFFMVTYLVSDKVESIYAIFFINFILDTVFMGFFL
jgi:hypothetical protein